MAEPPAEQPGVPDINKRWVRVTGTHGDFVLFDFTIGDPDLTVELILPFPAFLEFCATNHAPATVEPAAQAAYERLHRRSWTIPLPQRRPGGASDRLL